jgi:glycerol transport system permease protein
MIPAIQLFSSAGLIDTYFAVALAHCLFTVPISIWILEGFMSSVPTELEETAAIDGYSPRAIFFKIMLPQFRAGIGVTAFYCFIFSWVELVLANALTTVNAKPIGVVMRTVASPLGGFHVGIAAAASILMLIPGAALAWFLRRHLARGFSMGRVS